MGVITDKISTCKYQADLIEAAQLQNEVAFFVERDRGNPHNLVFNTRVQLIYNRDQYKFQRFVNAFKGEKLPTINVCETIYTDLYKVWDSQNKYINRVFSVDEFKDIADEELEKLDKYYKNDLWEARKTKFCSYLVVDLPKEQKGFSPEPYTYIVDVSNVKYIEFDKNKEVKEIIFSGKAIDSDKKEVDAFYYYTDEFYSVYKKDESEEVLLWQNYHDLGYCPAHRVCNTFANSKSLVLTKNELSSVTEEMFWFVFKTIEKNKADLLYLNPDKQAPKNSCDYNNGNEKCFGGKLVNVNKNPNINNTPVLLDDKITWKLCPVCGQHQHNSGGAGNVITIDMSKQAILNGKVNPASPLIHYISPDIEGVVKQHEWLQELREYIVKSCAGAETVQTQEAINEKQQIASFESKESVLKKDSDDISETIEWNEKTHCKLKFGKYFKDNSYYLGDKWHLLTIDDLLDRKSKTSNPIEKSELNDQIIETKYKNNPDKLEREKLLYKLLPYAHLSDSEFIGLCSSDRVQPEDEILRLDFISIISQFEAEWGSLVSFYRNFKDNIKPITRLSIIKDILKTYYKTPILTKKEENV